MSTNPGQIIALGGGGFSTEPENLALDSYVLSQARSPRPRVCLLATASGDSNRLIANFYAAFTHLDCQPKHLPLFARTPDLRELIGGQDVIYVGGGNTKSMLAVWREWGLPELLYEAWESGAVLAGISAGAMCWFEQGLTDSWAGHYSLLDCLGLLKGSCCPHYDSEAARRPAYHDYLMRGEALEGYAIQDGAALHFAGDEMLRAVSSHKEKKVFRVILKEDTVIEVELPMEVLSPVKGV